MKVVKIIIVILFSIIESNNVCGQMVKFEGLLAAHLYLGSPEYNIIMKDTSFVIKLPSTETVKYSSVSLFHKENGFIAKERTLNERGVQTETRVVKIDMMGNIIDTLYNPNLSNGEYIEDISISPQDNYLLVVTRYKSKDNNAESVLSSPITIRIIELKTDNVVYEKKDFYMSLNINFSSSAWSFDEKKIAYEIISRSVQINDEPISNQNTLSKENGIYILDIEKDIDKLFIEEGYYATWSPNSNKLAFVKDGKINIHDFSNNTTQLLYEKNKIERILEIRWFPNGKYLFVSIPKRITKTLSRPQMLYHEKLFDVNMNKEVAFEMLNLHSVGYTWR